MNRSITSAVEAMISNKDARILDAQFRNLRKDGGRLTTEAVWQAAQHKASPLYRFFLHDSESIQRAYGLERARYLIKSVRLIMVPEETVSKKVQGIIKIRAWSKHTGTNEYLPTEEMMSVPDLREDLLHRALQELENFKRKYAVLNELADLIRFIDATAEKLRKAEKAAA